MAKALVLCSRFSTSFGITTHNLRAAGINALSAGTEDLVKLVLQEGAVFSRLGGYLTASSPNPVLSSRANAAAGAQSVTITGLAFVEDTVNSDTMISGQSYNMRMVVSAGASTGYFIRQHVEMTDYGTFLMATGSVNFNTASATRYIPISGELSLNSGGVFPEWKNYGFTHCTMIQLTVSSNLRTTNTLLHLQVNGTNQLTLTIPPATTGVLTQTGNVAIAPGDTLRYQIVNGTGSETLTLINVTGGFKSTASRLDFPFNGSLTHAGGTGYIPFGGLTARTNEVQARVPIGYSGKVSNIRARFSSIVGTGALYLRKNGVRVISLNVVGGTTFYEESATPVDFSDTDELSYEYDFSSLTSATLITLGATIEATNIVSGAGTASGSSAAAAVAPTISSSVGLAEGTSGAAAAGVHVMGAQGTSAGSSTVEGDIFVFSIGYTAGSVNCLAVVLAVGTTFSQAVGTSEGSSEVLGIGKQVGWRRSGAVSGGWTQQEVEV